MSRNLIRRIDKLEKLWSAPERARLPLVLCVPSEHDGALAPGGRRVQDWFRDGGSMVWARERVTTETAEEGRRCPDVSTADLAFTDSIRFDQNSLIAFLPEMISPPGGRMRASAV
jgi:hypothetical protein